MNEQDSLLDAADREHLALHAVLRAARQVVKNFVRGSDAGYDELRQAVEKYDNLERPE